MQPLPDRLPLVIGVTGHRDLRDEDMARLEVEVANVIASLRLDYLGPEGETPVIVLSALAEGADRLVARVALTQGARLIAPLPLPREEYRRDFEPGLKPGNAAEFDELLGQAIAAPVIPFTHGNSLEAVRSDSKKRAAQYRAVGLFIAQHCNVLIAIWDGDEANMAVGGTAEVVKFTREGIPLEVSRSARASLDGSEIGPVVHVVAPRQKEGSPAGKVTVQRWGHAVINQYRGGALKRWLGGAVGFAGRLFRIERQDGRTQLSDADRRELDAWETFGVLVALTRQFNHEAAMLVSGKRGRSQMAQSLDYLFDGLDPQALEKPDPKDIALTLAPRWSRLYSISDALASVCQAQFKRDWLLLFLLTFAAFFCFAMFSYQAIEPLLIAYSCLYVLIFIVFLSARRGRHQERFLDYRALAEALRVAVYWRLVGIGLRPSDVKADALGDGSNFDAHTVGVLANAYPLKQPSELAWVKICLRTLELLDRAEGVADERALDPVCHGIARRCWVHGQYAFFRRRGFHHNSVAEALETWASVLLMMTAFLLVPLILFVHVGQTVFFGVDLLMVIGLLPGSAAALAALSERLAFKAQARQYDRMRILFERAYQLLPERIDATNASLVRAVYRELGVEAMRENAEWVAVYRQRPIEPLP
ncbi:MAG TPA: hypothetical protein VG291_21165 [Xanthobacteraceae bacterium]|nr:hypothetical protein [Xanthobacteraceae bacterium]